MPEQHDQGKDEATSAETDPRSAELVHRNLMLVGIGVGTGMSICLFGEADAWVGWMVGSGIWPAFRLAVRFFGWPWKE
jgi:hypothetical protein